jgi:hypothetical protein
MKKLKRLLLPIVLLLAGLFAGSALGSAAHAPTTARPAAIPRTIISATTADPGEVCLSTTAACPSSAPTLSGAVGSTLNVAVDYGGSATAPGFNTFDISVLADSSVLSAPTTSAGVTVSGAFAVVAQICINGIIVMGTCSSTDGPGVVHVVAGSLSGFTNANQTLMTIHYSVVGSSAGSLIGYQTGCTGTSSGTSCVSLIGATGPLTEALQTASFNNALLNVPPPTFVGGKLHWTHHLSLSKSSGVQSFTAKVASTASIPLFVQVSVHGCFDSGTICVTGTSAVTQLGAGGSADISFTAAVPSNAVGLKICFTGQIFYGSTATSITALSPSTKSGCFAVVA